MHTGISVHGDRADLRKWLGVSGDQDVVWLPGEPAPHLANALAKIAGAYEWVTVSDLAVGLARTRAGARAEEHHWSPTVPALLGWLPTVPGWSVQLRDGVWCAVPAGPPPALNARDAVLVEVLRGDATGRRDLLAALTGLGYLRSTASVHLACSPLLVRVRDAQPLTGRLRPARPDGDRGRAMADG